MIDCVLDASVVLASYKEESGAGAANALLPRAIVSAVNHTEIISKLIEWDEAENLARAANERPVYSIADFTADLAFRAGLLRAATKSRGLSLGDRACLALALRENLPVYTADRNWAELRIGVEIVLIR